MTSIVELTIHNALGQKVDREVFEVTWTADAAEKEGFEHFTLKEINEQPTGVHATLHRRLDADDNIVLDGVKLTKEDLERYNKIYIVACGTAYHAGRNHRTKPGRATGRLASSTSSRPSRR